jgi:hypothetical protein
VQRLQVARRELALEAALAKLDRYDLLILDDIAYVSKDQAEIDISDMQECTLVDIVLERNLYAPLLAALHTIARLHDALRELQVLLMRHPPTSGAATDIVAAIRTALETDWTGVQRELVQAERALEEHAARHG